MTRDQEIDSLVSLIDETIAEFEDLKKSASAKETSMPKAGEDLQPDTDTLKAKSVKKSDDEEDEEAKKAEKEEDCEKAEDEEDAEKAEKEEDEKEEKAEKAEKEEDEKEEKAEKAEKEEDKKEEKEVKKSVEEENKLSKSMEALQAQVNELSKAVKDLMDSPNERKGFDYKNIKTLKKSAEEGEELLSKSEVAGKLLDLQKSGKDVAVEDIIKVDLGTDTTANAIAKKYNLI